MAVRVRRLPLLCTAYVAGVVPVLGGTNLDGAEVAAVAALALFAGISSLWSP